MKRSFLLLFLSALYFNMSAQSYLFDSIPEKLKRGANAVVRSEQCLFTILKPGAATWHQKVAITLLNDDSEELKTVSVDYDKFSKVNFLQGTVYDAKGEIVKTLGITDIQDRAAFSAGTFYSDDRVKVLTFPAHKYPYTIEFEYEVEFKSMPGYPSWEFKQAPGVAVEKSGIQIVVPTGMPFRSWTERLKNPVDSVIEKDDRIYTWQEENIQADSQYKYFYSAGNPAPALHVAPNDFIYGGYSGSMRSWKDFGAWAYSLIEGRDAIPEEQKQKISKLVEGAKDDREKVKRIYEYMQSGTRYVLIMLGIGGYQPALASDVSKTGYGDCKALTNYTKGLLAAANIKSFYTLVKAGREESPINRDFVDQTFNHIILCVPMKSDTVWLECTSQSLPFNYLGPFTDDRDVVIVTPQGGKLTRTPAFKPGENLLRTSGTVSLNNFGKSSVKLTRDFSGALYDQASGQFETSSEDELKRYLSKNLRFSDLKTGTVRFSETKSEKPVASLYYETTVNDFASLTSTQLTFSPALEMQAYMPDIPVEMEIKRSVCLQDSITYNLPIGYKVDAKPADAGIKSAFGQFSYKLEVKGDKLVCKRKFELNSQKISEESFGDFREFINSIARKDRELVILAKN
jgi:hypothetical protein